MTTWVAFDTETTGLEPGSRLLDLAAVAFDDHGTVLATFNQLVHPGMPIPPDASEINGITDDVVAGQPSTTQVLADFLAWLPSRSTLIAHNAPYDCDILTWEFQRAGLDLPKQRVIDTCLMAKALAETKDNRLQTLIRHHRLKVIGDAHRALPDADAVRQYFLVVRPRLAPVPKPWTGRCAHPKKLPRTLSALPTWVDSARRLRISYTDAHGATSKREITPYGYATTGSGLMIHGFCHLAGNRRQFKAERMTVLRLTSRDCGSSRQAKVKT